MRQASIFIRNLEYLIGTAVSLSVARPRRGGGLEGLNPSLSSGACHEICEELMRKYGGTPSRNVVHANTLVLVAHLVTFSAYNFTL